MTKDRRGTWAINQMPINVAPRKFERSRRLPEAGEAQPPRMMFRGSDASADRKSDREPVGGNGVAPIRANFAVAIKGDSSRWQQNARQCSVVKHVR
jgi:hypothetical protein